MNAFGLAFRKKLEESGFVTVRRGNETLWKRNSERGILYDTAEAVHAVLTDVYRTKEK